VTQLPSLFSPLPENPADWGVLFDWDGVVLDSSVQHKIAFERIAEEEHRTLPEGWFKLWSWFMKML